MKVLGIVCSPRLRGNTETLVQEALNSAKEAGAEVEIFTVAGKTMRPCDGCDSCKKTGKCHIKDDMQPLYEKMVGADGIIFGCPIYIWNVCAQAKIIMDRCYAFHINPHSSYVRGASRPLRNKIGAALITTGRVGGTTALAVFNHFFNSHRMLYAGGSIGFGSQENKEKIRQDERAMAEAKAVGRVVVRYINMVAKGAAK